MSSASNERIVKTPEPCGGRARVAGHRVHSALAYYFDHVEEIQQEIRSDRAFVEEFRRNHPSILDEKLGQESLKEAS